MSTIEPMASENSRRLAPSFALIIGIDNYAHCQKLCGAVADAKAVKQYFEEVLGTPSDRIRTLYNEEANRAAILAAFEELRSEEFKINKGDPIVIFYAGHGGELDPPNGWEVKNKIQCLLPQDFKAKYEGQNTKAVDGYEPIPDRTIGMFLEHIAKRKGDNITVIFDCCHSASGTRGRGDVSHSNDFNSGDLDGQAVFFECPPVPGARGEEFTPRTVELGHLIISEEVDYRIWGARIGKVHGSFALHGLRSHVLLAACREKEKAYEYNQRGQFTQEFLKTLRSCADNKLDLSYAEVIERIHLRKDQHPQCEGLNRHRILFDKRVTTGRQVWYNVQVEDGKPGYTINAGLAHSIAPGVELSLYNKEKFRLGSILVDEASSITDFDITTPASTILNDAFHAKVTGVGKVGIYAGDHPVLEEALRKIDENSINISKFRVVSRVEEASLQAVAEGDHVTFKILDERVRRFGLTELPYKSTLRSVDAHVLPAAAHFFWYLGLENKGSNLGTNRHISVNFYFLNREYDDVGTPYFSTEKPGYCRPDPDSPNSDIIDFVVRDRGRYGVEIRNNTPKDLFLNAFLFNNSSLSVALCYTQSSAGDPEVPLKKGETFTLGYGLGGTPPFTYSFEKGQNIDVGFLKIFLSTKPIDLSDIEQPSPFSDVHPPPTHDQRDANQPTYSPHARDVWFTVLIPVVQRRA